MKNLFNCCICCECTIAFLCLLFGPLIVQRYDESINAITDLEELTNGCMDAYTTIPDGVLENSLTDEGKRQGFPVLAFGVLLTIKVAIVLFAFCKMKKAKKCCGIEIVTNEN